MLAAVADNTLLSNFSYAARPDLPKLAFPGLVMPGVVFAEFNQGVRLGYFSAHDWSSIPRIDPTSAEVSALHQLSPSLDKGEQACIALAVRLQAIVVTDDRDARRVARSLGLKISGTLGALSILVSQNHLTIEAADELLAKMLSKGYRSPVTSIKMLLKD